MINSLLKLVLLYRIQGMGCFSFAKTPCYIGLTWSMCLLLAQNATAQLQFGAVGGMMVGTTEVLGLEVSNFGFRSREIIVAAQPDFFAGFASTFTIDNRAAFNVDLLYSRRRFGLTIEGVSQASIKLQFVDVAPMFDYRLKDLATI